MKKIKNDYDLEKMVNVSIHGMDIKKTMKQYLFANLIGFSPNLPSYIESYNKDIKEFTFRISIFLVYCLSIDLCLAYITKLLTKDAKINNANYKLRLFINELHSLEVNTSIELLKESEITKVNYRPLFIDSETKKFKPAIKQEKYIKVPLCNGYEETLLQEHIIGYKDYDISVNEPIKKTSYKLSKI